LKRKGRRTVESNNLAFGSTKVCNISPIKMDIVHEVTDITVIIYSVIFSVDAEVILLYHCSRNWQPPSCVLLLLLSLGSAEMI